MHGRESGSSLLEVVTALAVAGLVVLFAGVFMTGSLRSDAALRARVAADGEAREMGRRLLAMVERTSDRGGEYEIRASPGCRAPCEILRGKTARGAWSLAVRCVEDESEAQDHDRRLAGALRCAPTRCAGGRRSVLVLARPGRPDTTLPATGGARGATLRTAGACVRRAGDEWIVSLAAASADAAAGREILLPARRLGAAAGVDVPAWVQSSY